MPEKIGMASVLDMGDFLKGLKQYLDGMEKMDTVTTKKGGTMSAVLGGIGKVAAGVMAAGVAVGAAAIAGVGLVIKSTLPLASDFQSQLVGLQLAAGKSGLSFDELHDAALQVGGDTRLLGVSATGAADAMTGLFKAGLSATEIFGDVNGYMKEGAELGGALRASIDLAAATELDMVQASDLAAIALATFGGELETEEERANFVTFAMDNLVKAADASVASVSDLAAGMAGVGPVAAQFGWGIADVNNALAILSTRGIAGSEAGTALRSMMTSMMRPTTDVKDALAELNVELYNTDGTMKALPEIMGQIEKGFVGMTEEQRNQYVQTIAGTYGMKAMNTLLTEGVEGWDAMAEATAAATGIQAQAEARANTFTGRMEALQGQIETLKIGIGEAFLPVAQKLMGVFSEIVEEHGPAISAAFGAIGEWLGEKLPGMIGTAVTWFGENLPRAIGAVKEAIAWVTDAIAEFQRGFAWATSEGMDPFTAAASGVAEVLDNFLSEEVMDRIWDFVDWIKVTAAFVEENLTPVLAGFGAMIAAVVIPAFVSWAAAAIPAAIATAVALAPIILAVAAIGAAVGLLVKAWQTDWKGIRTTLTAFWEETAKPAFEALKVWFTEVLPVALATIRDWFVTAWENITAAVTDAWKKAVKIFEDVKEWFTVTMPTAIWDAWEMVKKTVTDAIEAVKATISEALAAIRAAWETAWSAVKNFLREAWDTIRTIFVTALILILDIFGIKLEDLITAWRTTWDAVSTKLSEIWEVIKTTVSEAAQAVYDYVKARIDEISESWGIVWDYVSEKATTIWEVIKTTVSEAAQAVYDFVKGKIDEIRDAWGIVWDAVSAKASEIWEAIKTVVSTAIQAVWKSITDMYDKIKSAVTKPLDDARQVVRNTIGDWISLGKDMVGGIASGIRDKAQDVINSIKDAIIAAIKRARALIAGFSPSRVFMDIGGSMMEGLALGVAKTAAIPIAVTSEVMHRISAPALWQRPAMTMPASTSSTVNVNMGGVNIYDQMGAAVFEARVRQIMASSVGG